MSLVAIAFIYLVIPETKNKSLEQISRDLKNKNNATRIRDNLAFMPCVINLQPLKSNARLKLARVVGVAIGRR